MFRFLLVEKNSFLFESVEKGKIRGRYTIIGLNPDKIWEINKKKITITFNGKKKIVNKDPLPFLNNLINNFKIKIPKSIPSMAAMLVGYFSYDVIRYIEKIPDSCKSDLKIPDVRLSRPKNLIIYDNVKKIIYYIENIFSDTKIKNHLEKYDNILKRFNTFKDYETISFPEEFSIKKNRNKIKSNISKNNFKNIVKKAKSHIKRGDIFQMVLSQRLERNIWKETFGDL